MTEDNSKSNESITIDSNIENIDKSHSNLEKTNSNDINTNTNNLTISEIKRNDNKN